MTALGVASLTCLTCRDDTLSASQELEYMKRAMRLRHPFECDQGNDRLRAKERE